MEQKTDLPLGGYIIRMSINAEALALSNEQFMARVDYERRKFREAAVKLWEAHNESA